MILLTIKNLFSYLDFHLEIDNGEIIIKKNSTTNVMTSLFRWFISDSSVAITQQYSYVILGNLPSAVQYSNGY